MGSVSTPRAILNVDLGALPGSRLGPSLANLSAASALLKPDKGELGNGISGMVLWYARLFSFR